MSKIVKSALLNAFIFPGSGQLLLQRTRRGWAFIACGVLCFAALVYVIVNTVRTLVRNNPESLLAGDVAALHHEVSVAMMQSGGAMINFAAGGLIVVWLAALCDALFIKK